MHERRFIVLALAALCASCAVGPQFHRPSAPDSLGYSPQALPATTQAGDAVQGGAQRVVIGARVQRDWWTALGSHEIDAAVAKALAFSPTVAQARAALRVAQENVAAQRGSYFPTVAAGYAFNRTKESGAVPPNATPVPAGATSIFNFHTAQVTVGFTPDVFGGNRRQVESLQAQADAQRFELDAARLTLASNVVGAAIQDAMLRRQIALVQEMLASGDQSLAILRHQWKAGAVSHLDVALQENAVAQTRQLLPPLRKQFELNRDLLRALMGAAQDTEVATFDLDALVLPSELPVALPAQLVEQRPDVRAAQEQWHSASAQIGVARAARLPQFSISGDAGGGAMHIADLFGPGGRFFSFVVQLTQPIFDGGTLRHREAAAHAAYDQAAAQYQTAVLTALQNVADALHAIQTDAQALAFAAEAARSARTTLELTQRQWGHGYLDRVALISAEQTHRQAEIALLQARAARLSDTVALFQALGGGWEDAAGRQP